MDGGGGGWLSYVEEKPLDEVSGLIMAYKIENGNGSMSPVTVDRLPFQLQALDTSSSLCSSFSLSFFFFSFGCFFSPSSDLAGRSQEK